MEAKELRIGNLVLAVLPNKYWVVDDLAIHHMANGNIQSVYDTSLVYAPVPLTPEILEKIGGKNKGGWVGYFYEAEVYGEDVRIVWQLMDGRLSIFANDNLIKHEESPTVHSFQNSVYYLTGEELKIEL